MISTWPPTGGSAQPKFSTIRSVALFPAESLYPGLVEALLPRKIEMVLVIEKQQAHHAPEIIVPVRVIERHRPPLRLRRKAAEKKDPRLLRQERFEGMAFRFHHSMAATAADLTWKKLLAPGASRRYSPWLPQEAGRSASPCPRCRATADPRPFAAVGTRSVTAAGTRTVDRTDARSFAAVTAERKRLHFMPLRYTFFALQRTHLIVSRLQKLTPSLSEGVNSHKSLTY